MWILKSGRISIHLIRSVSPPVPNQWIGSEHPYCIRVYSNLVPHFAKSLLCSDHSLTVSY